VADLHTDFEAAVASVSQLATDPGNDVKLRLYALYKQATVGDVEGKRPGFTNPVARAKYDAWARTTGMAPDDARRAYVDLADELRG
jgi:diazepam-binding inhibitor (GABA receptor modulator, acyl-CoA-binding protein)